MSKVLLLAIGFALILAAPAAAQDVLVVSDGSTHESTEAGIEAIQELGDDNGFAVETDRAELANLADYRAVVFLNAAGDVLTAAEERQLADFVSAGGGFVGIHDAARLEPGSAYFDGLIGARPAESPDDVQEAVVEVADRVHPATKDVPLAWTRSD